MTFQAYELQYDPPDKYQLPREWLSLEESPAGPIQLLTWAGKPTTNIPLGGSAVLLPIADAIIMWAGVAASIKAGGYALVPGGASVEGGAGLIIYTPAYVGLAHVGGPVEPAGRLHYIDGCSDSLLICPATKGEPCLNLLHLPPGIHQTEHTHPSARIGIILRGQGFCHTPDQTFPLVPGMFWLIPPNGRHSFHTEDDSLDVFAWHPDSDFGPSHDAHPMLNRTIVEGVSAADETHRGIRTTEIRA